MTSLTISTSLRDNAIAVIRAAGLVPIPVIDDTAEEDSKGLTFNGSLDEFLKAVSDIGDRVVFVATKSFTQDEFDGAVERVSDESEGASKRNFLKQVHSAQCYIGTECEMKLTVRNGAFVLNYFHVETWWIHLLDVTAEAYHELKIEREAQREALEAESAADRAKVLKELQNLIRDDSFAKMPTQRAMVAYAIDAVDDIELILDEDEIKSEVQKLNDRLIARGLRKA
jgi:hypothetical protein